MTTMTDYAAELRDLTRRGGELEIQALEAYKAGDAAAYARHQREFDAIEHKVGEIEAEAHFDGQITDLQDAVLLLVMAASSQLSMSEEHPVELCTTAALARGVRWLEERSGINHEDLIGQRYGAHDLLDRNAGMTPPWRSTGQTFRQACRAAVIKAERDAMQMARVQPLHPENRERLTRT
ncbi:MAG: hypothetical protein RIM84_21035 [Alphaproteobacteria bacterium]